MCIWKLISLSEFKGWEHCDWESFPKIKIGHDAIVCELKKIVEENYHLKLEEFDEREACIAEKLGRRPHIYVAHTPDIIINVGERPEDRIFIEYVNSARMFKYDLRGMVALSKIIKRYLGFVLAIRDSIYPRFWIKQNVKEILEPMSLKSLLFALDQRNYNYLVGK